MNLLWLVEGHVVSSDLSSEEYILDFLANLAF